MQWCDIPMTYSSETQQGQKGGGVSLKWPLHLCRQSFTIMNRIEMCFIAFLRTPKSSQSGHPLAVYTSCLCSDKPRWCQVCILNKYLPADWHLFVRMPLSSRVAKQLSARSSAFPRLIASAPSSHIQIQHRSRWARTRMSSPKIIALRTHWHLFL